jgi:hypothetical protein
MSAPVPSRSDSSASRASSRNSAETPDGGTGQALSINNDGTIVGVTNFRPARWVG